MSSFIAQMPLLDHHLPVDVREITATGVTALWISFGLLFFSTICFAIGALQKAPKHRVFHHITLMITLIASLAYLAMANGIGAALIKVPGTDVYRQCFYARYLDWTLTTPLLLLDLALLAGLPAVEISLIVIADVGMILTGLIATFAGTEEAHWGFYVISCLFFVYVLYGLIIAGRKTAYLRTDKVGNAYTSIMFFTAALWLAYPVVWFLAEGKDILSPDAEIITYCVLDVAAKAVFGFWLLSMHSNIKEAASPYPASWIDSPRADYGIIGGSVPSAEE